MHKITACLMVLTALSSNVFGQEARKNSTAFKPYSPVVVASVKRTGITQSIPQTMLLTPTRNALYRISAYGIQTVTNESSGVTFSFTYTDDAGIEGQSFGGQQGVRGCGLVSTQVFSCSFTGIVRDNAGVPLTFYTSVNGNATYDLFITVEELQ